MMPEIIDKYFTVNIVSSFSVLSSVPSAPLRNQTGTADGGLWSSLGKVGRRIMNELRSSVE